MKMYSAQRNEHHELVVTVDGKALDPRLDLRCHSPDGFECGYGGSGPSQLALALLADCLGDEVALDRHHLFKWAVVAKLPEHRWTLTSEEIQRKLAVLNCEARPL
jgi:hypothetical protein